MLRLTRTAEISWVKNKSVMLKGFCYMCCQIFKSRDCLRPEKSLASFCRQQLLHPDKALASRSAWEIDPLPSCSPGVRSAASVRVPLSAGEAAPTPPPGLCLVAAMLAFNKRLGPGVAWLKPVPVPIKSRATKPEAPALLMGSGAPPLPPLIDSVRRLINVECFAAEGQEASYPDRLRRRVARCSALSVHSGVAPKSNITSLIVICVPWKWRWATPALAEI